MFPDTITAFDRVYIPKQEVIYPPRFRFVWDDECIDYRFKSRTLDPDFVGPSNPPAVYRFYPQMAETGDYRVNLEKDASWQWWDTFAILNGGDYSDAEYLAGAGRAQFNTTGWPRMAYLGMSGNEIRILARVGEWVRFETLKPTDWLRARSMTRVSHPYFIHSFTCVSWKDGRTVRIESTGTPRGIVYYPLVTWAGYAYIPARHVVRI
jgi:hypothetical protein